MWYVKRWSVNASTDFDAAMAECTWKYATQSDAVEGLADHVREEIAYFQNSRNDEDSEFCVARLYGILFKWHTSTDPTESHTFGGLAFGVYGRD